jgi:hypothetical protein
MACSGRTPEILACSDQEQSITMRYGAEALSSENAPDDWQK